MTAKFSQILKIIAQQATTTTQPAVQPAVQVSGAPTNFDPYSYWPSITTGWGSQNITLIRQLSNIINWSLFVLSQGELDMNKLRNANFIVDPSKYPDRILIMFVKLAIQVHRLIYTDLGVNYAAVVQDAPKRLQTLRNMLTTIPDGGINPTLQGKVGGNPKILILDILNQIR